MMRSPSIKYDITIIQDEARYLVSEGFINRQQPIYVLSQYMNAREWVIVERELEERNVPLSDRIGNLITNDQWLDD